MPYLVRDRLFIGDISAAAEILTHGSTEITHLLSLLSSASISFFKDWKPNLDIPAKEIRKVYAGSYHRNLSVSGSPLSSDDEGTEEKSEETSKPAEKLLYSLELAGLDLKFVRMAVPLRDMECENLLDYLDACLDFIDESRAQGQGSILVHCYAGVSRSAAIVTAYLMRTEQLSLEDALESLRQSCPGVSPNDGFLEQLKMFESMGFKVDPASSIYKRFRLTILGEEYNKGIKIDNSKFGADPGSALEVSSSEIPVDGEKPKSAFRCKKCRRVVALQGNVIEHAPGEGDTCFGWHKRKSSNRYRESDDPECSSIFVEPLRWMKTVEEGAMEGKLSCIHCEARLGYFNWSGIQCSCGSWITPAFQLHKSRIDISTA